MKPRFISVFLIANFVLAACTAKATSSLASPVGAEKTVQNLETVLKVQPAADECLACHADKERLIETAKPEEVVEAESSGAG